MATKIVFDMSDPEIKSMIDGWSDSREYQVMLTVRTGVGAKRNVCEVLDVEEEGGAEDKNPDDETAEGESSSPGAEAVKGAMGKMAAGKPGY